ncbi:10110_t:CDS:2 [Funneliformis caledonium]|uniref:10110_t:CDS:1 n=1 Tax=Funneliformis caledonium TaxID=1117310 RepID=A0A9N8YMH8_9GLOM|nr:10110_t:CDS:2 [Funneliformis caledonium]
MKDQTVCSYSFTELLKQVPEVLISGLKGKAAEWAINKYKLHRRLPKSIEKLIE